MSREIKFRAWDIGEKCWNGSDECDIDYFDLYHDSNVGIVNGLLKSERIGRQMYVWEQYTGLKDKNGKEIYEGDIVKFGTFDRMYQIVYRTWDCSFVGENDEDEDIFHLYDKFSYSYEVIGNIHENPELWENIKGLIEKEENE